MLRIACCVEHGSMHDRLLTQPTTRRTSEFMRRVKYLMAVLGLTAGMALAVVTKDFPAHWG
jgi:hypothetical protein